jgi:glycosyltransferase involved in cell wall biosynthesis
MRLGIAIEETWDFFNEIYADFQQNYATALFERPKASLPFFEERINRYLFTRQMKRFLGKQDVVFFEWASDLLRSASCMPKMCGIVTRLHRYEVYKWAEHVNWKNVDRVILVSNAKQREFIDRFPYMRDRTVVISESISLERFTNKARPFNGDIGILCHLTPRKRVYDLILEFYQLIQENDAFHLHIGGGEHIAYGDYYHAIQHLIDSLNLRNRVTLYGHVADTPAWYQTIDIFISNSYSEGLQVAPMEALASGCYTLSHRWDGAEELLPETQLYYTGRELRQKIAEYAQLPEMVRQQEKEKMRSWAYQKFDINQTITDIRQVIDEVAAQTMDQR